MTLTFLIAGVTERGNAMNRYADRSTRALGLAVLLGLGLALALLLGLSRLNWAVAGRGGETNAGAEEHSAIPSAELITSSCSFTRSVFLPLVTTHLLCDIFGRAILNGQPVSGAVIKLGSQTFEGSFSIDYTTTTGTDGSFCFSSVSVLPYCRGMWYNLGFQYEDQEGLQPEEAYVRSWSRGVLQRCKASQVYTDAQAELSDIIVITPTDNATVTLPVTFSWVHPAVEDENYTLHLLHSPECSPVIPVGAVQTVVITQTPSCMTLGVSISWYIMGSSNSNGLVRSRYHTVTIQPAE